MATAPSHAISIGDYKLIQKEQPKVAALYIKGVAEGFAWANSLNNDKNLPRLYCEPEKFSINTDNLTQILNDELTENNKIWTDKLPVELALFKGLEKTFPCK